MIPVTPWRASSYSVPAGNCVEVAGWRASLHSFNINCIEVGDWRRSVHSNGTNCAEAGTCACGVAIRDSKDQDGPVLLFSPAAWAAFTGVLK